MYCVPIPCSNCTGSVDVSCGSALSVGRMFQIVWARSGVRSELNLPVWEKDPKQYTNLFSKPEYAEIVAGLKQKPKAKLVEVSKNDLGKE